MMFANFARCSFKCCMSAAFCCLFSACATVGMSYYEGYHIADVRSLSSPPQKILVGAWKGKGRSHLTVRQDSTLSFTNSKGYSLTGRNWSYVRGSNTNYLVRNERGEIWAAIDRVDPGMSYKAGDPFKISISFINNDKLILVHKGVMLGTFGRQYYPVQPASNEKTLSSGRRSSSKPVTPSKKEPKFESNFE